MGLEIPSSTWARWKRAIGGSRASKGWGSRTCGEGSARLVRWQRAHLPSALFGSRCCFTDTFPNVKNTVWNLSVFPKRIFPFSGTVHFCISLAQSLCSVSKGGVWDRKSAPNNFQNCILCNKWRMVLLYHPFGVYGNERSSTSSQSIILDLAVKMCVWWQVHVTGWVIMKSKKNRDTWWKLFTNRLCKSCVFEFCLQEPHVYLQFIWWESRLQLLELVSQKLVYNTASITPKLPSPPTSSCISQT